MITSLLYKRCYDYFFKVIVATRTVEGSEHIFCSIERLAHVGTLLGTFSPGRLTVGLLVDDLFRRLTETCPVRLNCLLDL